MDLFKKLARMSEERLTRLHMRNNPNAYMAVKNDPMIFIPRETIRRMSKTFDTYYDIKKFPKEIPVPRTFVEQGKHEEMYSLAIQTMLDKKDAGLGAKVATLLSMGAGLSGVLTAASAGAAISASTIVSAPLGAAAGGYAIYKAAQKIRDIMSHIENSVAQRKSLPKSFHTCAYGSSHSNGEKYECTIEKATEQEKIGLLNVNLLVNGIVVDSFLSDDLEAAQIQGLVFVNNGGNKKLAQGTHAREYTEEDARSYLKNGDEKPLMGSDNTNQIAQFLQEHAHATASTTLKQG